MKYLSTLTLMVVLVCASAAESVTPQPGIPNGFDPGVSPLSEPVDEVRDAIVPLTNAEVSGLQELQSDNQELLEMTGGASKQFWRAVTIGGLVVLILIAL